MEDRSLTLADGNGNAARPARFSLGAGFVTPERAAGLIVVGAILFLGALGGSLRQVLPR